MLESTAPLAPWLQRQLRSLLMRQGHAWLLQGPSGLGQYELASALAKAWLCAQPHDDGACGLCPSCLGFDRHTHADLCTLMPETHSLSLGWPLDEKTQQELDDKKRKPSKDIRVEAARQMVAFSQTTHLGSRGQVVFIHPADRMNAITANTLLKTLEEPPGDTRFVLTTDSVHQLLPTIRSRCQSHAMQVPDDAEALAWLNVQGVPSEQAEVLWRASGGRPNWVLDRVRDGLSAEQWSQWPRQLARGQAGLLELLSPTEGLASLQKLCHDLLALSLGAAPRFFQPQHLPKSPSPRRAALWAAELQALVRHVEHPYNAGLQLQAWAVRARLAMRPD
ncbi:MAG: DNA polymerase III subunit [Alphaproteobacteria bacterium]|nr:DNA polymerase III subunit [Alphaproteobacteria bacterium]